MIRRISVQAALGYHSYHVND